MHLMQVKLLSCKFFSLCFLLTTFLFLNSASVILAAETNTPVESQLSENYSESQVDTILAGLDDTQVRQMLIQELKKDAQQPEATSTKPGQKRLGSQIVVWLRSMGEESDDTANRLTELIAFLPKFFPDLISSFSKIKPEESSLNAFLYILLLIGTIGISLFAEILFARNMTKKYFSIDAKALPQMGGPGKLISGFARIIPEIIAMFIFILTSYILVSLFFDTSHGPVRLFFVSALMLVILIRITTLVSQLVYSPYVLEFRIIPITCDIARNLHKGFIFFVSYLFTTSLLAILTKALGAQTNTVMILQLLAATTLVAMSIFILLYFKKDISQYILQAGSGKGNTSWAKNAFASIWHIPAVAYLLVLLALLIYDFSQIEQQPTKGAFLLSFMIVPIWMIMNSIVQWVVTSTMKTLHLHQTEYEDDGKEVLEEELTRREEGQKLHVKVANFARILVTMMVALWLANLWDFYIPYLSELSGVFFDTLIILATALVFWQMLSGWIERKINSSIPEEEEVDEDSEWGGAGDRGRSYTLLPMIRKFIGSILVVMVTLTILSSMGVDIGPLLAGAGVLGLAIGFGAQKLVSDVFSGFFYLLDDAFRVGEYLDAGGVSGTVESITLRNVMLRHHRGMLQIVPHSDLGAVTNYMRGGMIVKFNLDFPYDANIDQIRKVIKKVGQAMLKDEELGKDFIQPVKSGGVREIANSVMTIRVKFTAEPGTHFVLRREAYKRITEALALKGIPYAHRKVIVDIPQPVLDTAAGAPNPDMTLEQAKQIIGAAGAAASATLQEEEEKAAAAAATKK